MDKLTKDELKLTDRWLKFYRELDSGARLPTTDAQKRFVRVCTEEDTPSTEHELAYIKWKHLNKISPKPSHKEFSKSVRLDRIQRANDKTADKKPASKPIAEKTFQSSFCPLCQGEGGLDGGCEACGGTGWLNKD
jgi:uncharacterized protein YifE (UPF0438 family)|tara:strand:+ start:149 stop:553 length:405 start_codon:yes stop_codon:yes gene_type:complete